MDDPLDPVTMHRLSDLFAAAERIGAEGSIVYITGHGRQGQPFAIAVGSDLGARFLLRLVAAHGVSDPRGAPLPSDPWNPESA